MRKKWAALVAAVAAVGVAVATMTSGTTKLSATARLKREAAVADSLIMSATWSNPTDDGKGAIDSLKIRFMGIFFDSSLVFKTQPFPTTATVRQLIPAAAYSGAGGSATFDILISAATYRRGTNAVPLLSNKVTITLNDAAPPNVGSLNLTATKKP